MTDAICTSCGTRFDNTGKPWARKCWGCWRDDKDRAREAELRAQWDLEARRRERLVRERAYEEGWESGHRAGKDEAKRLDPDFLHSLIQLCHPDRHPPERSEMANAITAELLRLRREAA